MEHGCRIFDFGRTRCDNAGSFDFKRFHGFEARRLYYKRRALGDGPDVRLTPTNPRFALARRIWPRLPLVVTRSLGASLSRWIPG